MDDGNADGDRGDGWMGLGMTKQDEAAGSNESKNEPL
jgi:hypothetical protein